MSDRPIITSETTLAELQAKGADCLADIPLTELLEFIRNQCLGTALDKEMGEAWVTSFSNAALDIQQAIEHINEAIRSDV